MSASSGSRRQWASSSTSFSVLPSSSSQASEQARRYFWEFQGLRRDDSKGDSRDCWSLEAKKLDSSRHGGGEEHGRKLEGGNGQPGSRGSSSSLGDDNDVSPGRNTPLRWMRKTLTAGWGSQGRRANAHATAGRWGLHGGISGRGRVSVGRTGQQDREVSMVEVEEAETGKRGNVEKGWGLSGWVNAGKKGMSGEAVRHAWFSDGGGGGHEDHVGKQVGFCLPRRMKMWEQTPVSLLRICCCYGIGPKGEIAEL